MLEALGGAAWFETPVSLAAFATAQDGHHETPSRLTTHSPAGQRLSMESFQEIFWKFPSSDSGDAGRWAWTLIVIAIQIPSDHLHIQP